MITVNKALELESQGEPPSKKARRLSEKEKESTPQSAAGEDDSQKRLALRKKKDSSMRVAVNLVKSGNVQACVSAGNTGALMAVSRYVLKTMADVDRPAGELAYGQKRALEMALVLALDPKVMLLDEPTAGMGREDVERTIELVRRIAAGRTVVFVDHNMHVVGSLAHHVTVLMAGEVLAQGTYQQVRTDERVISAYLGEESHA